MMISDRNLGNRHRTQEVRGGPSGQYKHESEMRKGLPRRAFSQGHTCIWDYPLLFLDLFQKCLLHLFLVSGRQDLNYMGY